MTTTARDDIHPELLGLFHAATADGGLGRGDLLILRDICALSGHTEPEAQAAILCLLLARDEGSLCVSLDAAGLTRQLARVAGPGATERWASRIESRFAGPALAELAGLVSVAGAEYTPLIVHEASGGRRFLYFQRHYAHARRVQRMVEALRSRDDERPSPAVLDEALREVLESADPSLSPEQASVVALGASRPLLVVSGGPGTGKTFVVFTLLRCLARLGTLPGRVALAAPSGRAAQALTDAIARGLGRLSAAGRATPEDEALAAIGGSTLHRLLGYSPTRRRFTHHSGNPLPADVVIVDEVSMVDVGLMAALLDALGGARLILVGDKDQLPSVEAGAVLADLMPHGGAAASDSFVVLGRNFRSQAHIRHVAAHCTGGEPDAAALVEQLPALPYPAESGWPDLADLRPPAGDEPGGCWVISPDAAGREWPDVVAAWAEAHYIESAHGRAFREALGEWADLSPDEAEERCGSAGDPILARLFDCLDAARILTLVRGGRQGCEWVNEAVEDLVRPRLDPPGVPGRFAGRPVLVTRNDYSLGLFNGQVGVTVRDGSGRLSAVFRRAARYHRYSLESLPAHESGFALTVHKAQGSEYGQVLVALPTEPTRLLSRQIVYTAITRGRDLAVLYATRDMLAQALAAPIQRDTGLELFEKG